MTAAGDPLILLRTLMHASSVGGRTRLNYLHLDAVAGLEVGADLIAGVADARV